ncbi:hypothetical protein, partial [Neobacillus jeddahensis]|uniref:hypothetical protein n=1 Tax=Neobacillus jeddahensis TaxID=1461580 RepID=UPI001B7D8A73
QMSQSPKSDFIIISSYQLKVNNFFLMMFAVSVTTFTILQHEYKTVNSFYVFLLKFISLYTLSLGVEINRY